MSKSSFVPRKPEPYRATTRGNILKVVQGDSKRGSIAKDRVHAKRVIADGRAKAAAIRAAEAEVAQ